MSLFHSLKKSIATATGEKKEDKDEKYQEAAANFEQFAALLQALKTHVDDGQARMRAYCESVSLVSNDFAAIFSTSKEKHAYSQAQIEHKKASDDLLKDKYDKIALYASSSMTNKLAENVDKISKLKARIAERETQRTEMEYYIQKTAGLQEKLRKGTEKQADREKRERNEQKSQSLQNIFKAFNASLIEDLQNVWNTRLDVVGPILADFSIVQQRFGQAVAAASAVNAAGPIDSLSTFLGGEGGSSNNTVSSGSMRASASAAASTSVASGSMSGSVSSKAATPAATYVRALYDLNTDDEENLKFSEGDIIRVLTPNVDWNSEDGPAWLTGVPVKGGNEGQFPRNYVQKIADSDLPLSLTSSTAAAPAASASGTATTPSAASGKYPPGVYVKALYDLSTDDPDNLTFVEGDIIRLTTPNVDWTPGNDEPAWLSGVLVKGNGIEGQFPKNYVGLAAPSDLV